MVEAPIRASYGDGYNQLGEGRVAVSKTGRTYLDTQPTGKSAPATQQYNVPTSKYIVYLKYIQSILSQPQVNWKLL